MYKDDSTEGKIVRKGIPWKTESFYSKARGIARTLAMEDYAKKNDIQVVDVRWNKQPELSLKNFYDRLKKAKDDLKTAQHDWYRAGLEGKPVADFVKADVVANRKYLKLLQIYKVFSDHAGLEFDFIKDDDPFMGLLKTYSVEQLKKSGSWKEVDKYRAFLTRNGLKGKTINGANLAMLNPKFKVDRKVDKAFATIPPRVKSYIEGFRSKMSHGRDIRTAEAIDAIAKTDMKRFLRDVTYEEYKKDPQWYKSTGADRKAVTEVKPYYGEAGRNLVLGKKMLERTGLDYHRIGKEATYNPKKLSLYVHGRALMQYGNMLNDQFKEWDAMIEKEKSMPVPKITSKAPTDNAMNEVYDILDNVEHRNKNGNKVDGFSFKAKDGKTAFQRLSEYVKKQYSINKNYRILAIDYHDINDWKATERLLLHPTEAEIKDTFGEDVFGSGPKVGSASGYKIADSYEMPKGRATPRFIYQISTPDSYEIVYDTENLYKSFRDSKLDLNDKSKYRIYKMYGKGGKYNVSRVSLPDLDDLIKDYRERWLPNAEKNSTRVSLEADKNRMDKLKTMSNDELIKLMDNSGNYDKQDVRNEIEKRVMNALKKDNKGEGDVGKDKTQPDTTVEEKGKQSGKKGARVPGKTDGKATGKNRSVTPAAKVDAEILKLRQGKPINNPEALANALRDPKTRAVLQKTYDLDYIMKKLTQLLGKNKTLNLDAENYSEHRQARVDDIVRGMVGDRPSRGKSPVFELEYHNLASRVRSAEKTPDRKLSPEEVKLNNKDWKAYSRSQGYSETDINNMEKLIKMTEEGKRRGYSIDELIDIEKSTREELAGKEVISKDPEIVESSKKKSSVPEIPLKKMSVEESLVNIKKLKEAIIPVSKMTPEEAVDIFKRLDDVFEKRGMTPIEKVKKYNDILETLMKGKGVLTSDDTLSIMPKVEKKIERTDPLAESGNARKDISAKTGDVVEYDPNDTLKDNPIEDKYTRIKSTERSLDIADPSDADSLNIDRTKFNPEHELSKMMREDDIKLFVDKMDDALKNKKITEKQYNWLMEKAMDNQGNIRMVRRDYYNFIKNVPSEKSEALEKLLTDWSQESLGKRMKQFSGSGYKKNELQTKFFNDIMNPDVSIDDIRNEYRKISIRKHPVFGSYVVTAYPEDMKLAEMSVEYPANDPDSLKKLKVIEERLKKDFVSDVNKLDVDYKVQPTGEVVKSKDPNADVAYEARKELQKRDAEELIKLRGKELIDREQKLRDAGLSKSFYEKYADDIDDAWSRVKKKDLYWKKKLVTEEGFLKFLNKIKDGIEPDASFADLLAEDPVSLNKNEKVVLKSVEDSIAEKPATAKQEPVKPVDTPDKAETQVESKVQEQKVTEPEPQKTGKKKIRLKTPVARNIETATAPTVENKKVVTTVEKNAPVADTPTPESNKVSVKKKPVRVPTTRVEQIVETLKTDTPDAPKKTAVKPIATQNFKGLPKDSALKTVIKDIIGVGVRDVMSATKMSGAEKMAGQLLKKVFVPLGLTVTTKNIIDRVADGIKKKENPLYIADHIAEEVIDFVSMGALKGYALPMANWLASGIKKELKPKLVEETEYAFKKGGEAVDKVKEVAGKAKDFLGQRIDMIASAMKKDEPKADETKYEKIPVKKIKKREDKVGYTPSGLIPKTAYPKYQ